LTQALAPVRDHLERETTARNLRFICEARDARLELQPRMARIVEALNRRAAKV